MKKAEFISLIAMRGNMTKRKAEETVKMMFEILAETMVSGDEVSIPTFGRFKTFKRAARTGLNPITKKKIKIPATTLPKFVPFDLLKRAVKK